MQDVLTMKLLQSVNIILSALNLITVVKNYPILGV